MYDISIKIPVKKCCTYIIVLNLHFKQTLVLVPSSNWQILSPLSTNKSKA